MPKENGQRAGADDDGPESVRRGLEERSARCWATFEDVVDELIHVHGIAAKSILDRVLEIDRGTDEPS